MFPLKKSLLLPLFLGVVSLSLCEEERAADEDEVIEEVKRGIMSKIKGTVQNAAVTLLNKLQCKITGGC
uniref:Odorranain-F-AJ antimicrobial peptide n=1 Tax=Amolops jingdongensis TaxID=1077530 RepID=K7Z435_AMOJI|nr:odorranain-F-AJ antimicrobial peptide precursor [Amolops sp. 'jingdongensis']